MADDNLPPSRRKHWEVEYRKAGWTDPAPWAHFCLMTHGFSHVEIQAVLGALRTDVRFAYRAVEVDTSEQRSVKEW